MNSAESFSKTPESSNESHSSPWDILSELPSFEENLKSQKDINSQIDDYIASQQEIRQKQSQEAYMDGVLASTFNDVEQKLANDVQNIMEIEEETAQNKYAHEHDPNFQYGMQYGLKHRAEVTRGERIREIIEKDLNNRLTKVADLEELADIEGTGITSSEVLYNQEKIKVLNLTDVPFNMLTHSIDFKQTDIHQVNGQGTSNTLRVFPALWLNRLDQTKLDKNSYNARSNAIFTTYSNPNNPNSRPVGGDVIYGFDHVDANSILKLNERDGNTPLVLNYHDNLPSENQLDFFDKVENGASHGAYNEVAFKRYDETGKPRIPDYLVTYNGHISEDAKHHAYTFNVPIINIIRKTKDEQR